jgi:hypothetical protein
VLQALGKGSDSGSVYSYYLLSNFVQSASIIYLGVIAQFVGGFDCSMMIAV